MNYGHQYYFALFSAAVLASLQINRYATQPIYVRTLDCIGRLFVQPGKPMDCVTWFYVQCTVYGKQWGISRSRLPMFARCRGTAHPSTRGRPRDFRRWSYTRGQCYFVEQSKMKCTTRFNKSILTMSAVSSTNLGSVLIFASCVTHRPSVFSKFS